MSSKKKSAFKELKTPFESSGALDWTEYPRPQMKRQSYMSLCGEWELCLVGKEGVSRLGSIVVPFPPESRISGIKRPLAPNEKYLYKKSFVLNESFNVGRILLHFGAVDQIARVWINGKAAGKHTGGYLPFSLEIGRYVTAGENQIVVEVTDTLDHDLAYGKQRYKRGGMWYTPISGIWQAVWLESVPESYIHSLAMTPTLNSITIETKGGSNDKSIIIHTDEGELRCSWRGDSVTITLSTPHLWTPDDPYLYTFILTAGEDVIDSYFALRTISILPVKSQAYICLNNEPYFFNGLLDQGYFSDGIYLPATPEGYIWDIRTAKRLGFNMLRKHIKIEPELFYYYCDKYGMIVFQDMVNSGNYNFLIDTALPTMGIRQGIKHMVSKRRREHFERDCRETVEFLYNHPCVCYYTIFNEGWGQYDADRIYRELKAYDPTRIWDAASGWFAERDSDVKSEHIYFRKIALKSDPERPLVLSEYGGYSYKVADHSYNLEKNYGYKSFRSAETLADGLSALFREELIPAIKQGLCAAVLTQLSDVEDETNGLVTYDRMVVKVPEKTMMKLGRELQEAFNNKVE
ncbi:MAG: glycoside hydrolase family 2 [Ruminococcaceae bacterium]|nr:glycoside hydrolase family 2 [Oscillospiraceae bacterium]